MNEDFFSHCSYFRAPPHIEIGLRLFYWKKWQHYPTYSSSLPGYGDKQVACSALEDIALPLHLLELSPSSIGHDREVMTSCFQVLTPHHLQHLLGFRHTVGSVDLLYPPRSYLLACFQQLNNPKSKLTVGARALCKHCIRCKSTWGEWDSNPALTNRLKGQETVQNEVALSTLLRLLEHASWMNIHLLPHDVVVLEIRIESGFGCRWDLAQGIFRGFVEPYMENGYEVGWVHNDS